MQLRFGKQSPLQSNNFRHLRNLAKTTNAILLMEFFNMFLYCHHKQYFRNTFYKLFLVARGNSYIRVFSLPMCWPGKIQLGSRISESAKGRNMKFGIRVANGVDQVPL